MRIVERRDLFGLERLNFTPQGAECTHRGAAQRCSSRVRRHQHRHSRNGGKNSRCSRSKKSVAGKHDFGRSVAGSLLKNLGEPRQIENHTFKNRLCQLSATVICFQIVKGRRESRIPFRRALSVEQWNEHRQIISIHAFNCAKDRSGPIEDIPTIVTRTSKQKFIFIRFVAERSGRPVQHRFRKGLPRNTRRSERHGNSRCVLAI